MTSAGHAHSYIVSAGAVGDGPTDSTLYYVERATGPHRDGPWNGLGLRANASAPVRLADAVVDPQMAVARKPVDPRCSRSCFHGFNSARRRSARDRPRVARGHRAHLSDAKLEHLGETLASLPTARARLASAVQLDASARWYRMRAIGREPATRRRRSSSKACADETALGTCGRVYEACGGAAFSRHSRSSASSETRAPEP